MQHQQNHGKDVSRSDVTVTLWQKRISTVQNENYSKIPCTEIVEPFNTNKYLQINKMLFSCNFHRFWDLKHCCMG